MTTDDRRVYLQREDLPAAGKARFTTYVVHAASDVGGDDVLDAFVTEDTSGLDRRPQVALRFTGPGGKRFADLTGENVGERLAIVLDDEIVSAPTIQSKIANGEGVITLVRSLLAFGEEALAAAQVEKALAWLNSLDRRNPERATIWGLAEVYLDAHKPDVALRLLETRITQPSFGERLRRMVGSRPNDDELRDNRLRFQALLQMQPVWDKAHQAIYDQLRQWAPRLLEGEALINFYAEGLLRPLLLHGHTQQVWPLLDEVRAALAESRGDKHTRQVQRVAAVLAQHAVPKEIAAAYPVDPAAHNGAHDGVQNGTHNGDGDAPTPATLTDPTEAHAALTRFALDLWQDDVPKGLWQTIHGIEGMLSLVLALDGPASLVLVAQMAAREGPEWDK